MRHELRSDINVTPFVDVVLVLFADTRLDVAALKRAIHMADAAGYNGVGLIALKTPGK
jgi:hypothetical protein